MKRAIGVASEWLRAGADLETGQWRRRKPREMRVVDYGPIRQAEMTRLPIDQHQGAALRNLLFVFHGPAPIGRGQRFQEMFMPVSDHRDYYARRESEARALAEACKDAGVRKIHLGMAERYAQIAQTEPVITTKPVGNHFDLL
ncbi:hypothetical protein FHS49_003343 [Sphingobium boeckii]|uniref:Uncharacterized protein n=2 Tax=Sphingobium boeckii TaxID=1082345 RepID=A0A7W9AKG8_9SPHN|nr:hypothetical protein [Sphingobium boeckii]